MCKTKPGSRHSFAGVVPSRHRSCRRRTLVGLPCCFVGRSAQLASANMTYVARNSPGTLSRFAQAQRHLERRRHGIHKRATATRVEEALLDVLPQGGVADSNVATGLVVQYPWGCKACVCSTKQKCRTAAMQSQCPPPKKPTRLCTHCGKPLSAIGHARKNGAKHADWHSRHMHKACWKAMQPARPRPKFFKKRRF